MIKIKMIDLLNSIDALEKIGQQELDGVQAYKIGKALNEISKEINNYTTIRQELITKYGETNNDGNVKIIDNKVIIKPEYIEIFNEKIAEMNNVEIELNITEFNLDDLEKIKLTPREISTILWIIK